MLVLGRKLGTVAKLALRNLGECPAKARGEEVYTDRKQAQSVVYLT
jgi:hypothetical protein